MEYRCCQSKDVTNKSNNWKVIAKDINIIRTLYFIHVHPIIFMFIFHFCSQLVSVAIQSTYSYFMSVSVTPQPSFHYICIDSILSICHIHPGFIRLASWMSFEIPQVQCPRAARRGEAFSGSTCALGKLWHFPESLRSMCVLLHHS